MTNHASMSNDNVVALKSRRMSPTDTVDNREHIVASHRHAVPTDDCCA